MADGIKQQQGFGRQRETVSISITVGMATAPVDGTDLDTLIVSARRKAEPLDDLTPGQTSIH